MDGCYTEYDALKGAEECRKDGHGETGAYILGKLVLARESVGFCRKS